MEKDVPGFVAIDAVFDGRVVELSIAGGEPIKLDPESISSMKDTDVRVGRALYIERPIKKVEAPLFQPYPQSSTVTNKIGYLKTEIDRAYDRLEKKQKTSEIAS